MVYKLLQESQVSAMISDQQQHLPLSPFYVLERKAPSHPALSNPCASVQAQLSRLRLPAEKLRGRRIAVTVGSRGIASLQEIVRGACGWLQAQGARPIHYSRHGQSWRRNSGRAAGNSGGVRNH